MNYLMAALLIAIFGFILFSAKIVAKDTRPKALAADGFF